MSRGCNRDFDHKHSNSELTPEALHCQLMEKRPTVIRISWSLSILLDNFLIIVARFLFFRYGCGAG
jgi:hypothetical protein